MYATIVIRFTLPIKGLFDISCVYALFTLGTARLCLSTQELSEKLGDFMLYCGAAEQEHCVTVCVDAMLSV